MRRTAECIDVKKGLRIAQTFFCIGNFSNSGRTRSVLKEMPKAFL